MLRRVALVPLLIAFSSAALSQTTGTGTTEESMQDRSPTENLRTAGDRRPGLTVRQAITRHQGDIGRRVNGPRNGEQPEVTSNNSGAVTGATGTTGGLGDLSSLLGLLGGVGGLGDLSGLLGGLTGTNLGGVTAGGTTTGSGNSANGTTGTSASGGTASDGTVDTLEELLELERQLTGGSTASAKSTTSAGLTAQTREFGGAIGRLPKRDATSQQSGGGGTADTRSFQTRLADSLLNTLFTSISAAVRLPFFVNLIADGLRPLIAPGTIDNDNGNDNSNGNGNGNNNNNGNNNSNNNSNDNGDTIDDLPPGDNDNDNDNGSVVLRFRPAPVDDDDGLIRRCA